MSSVERKQQVFLAGAGTVDVDGREDALFRQMAIQIDLHVAGALEFFEDDFVHAGAGVDEGRGDDGQAAAFFDIARGTKDALGTLQGVGVQTTGKNAPRRGSHGVIGAAQTGDGVHEDDHVPLAFHQTLGFFQHHLADLHMALRRFVEGGVGIS